MCIVTRPEALAETITLQSTHRLVGLAVCGVPPLPDSPSPPPLPFPGRSAHTDFRIRIIINTVHRINVLICSATRRRPLSPFHFNNRNTSLSGSDSHEIRKCFAVVIWLCVFSIFTFFLSFLLSCLSFFFSFFFF